MNCNCIAQTEKMILEKFAPQVKAPIESVECGGVGFIIDNNTMTTGLFIPFFLKADAPGYRSAKGKSVSMYVTFCPFCGTAVKKPKAEAA
ncbi:MAG: hypothetical protein EPN62_05650 [Candidimonas sp.]|nr:MAG: hypothetical protein EPN62_05650 [Candidimonas sp.]